MDSTAGKTQTMTPTDAERLAVLTRYRLIRARGVLSPYAAMTAAAAGFARPCMLNLAGGVPADPTLARLWLAADIYLGKMTGRTRYWFAAPRRH